MKTLTEAGTQGLDTTGPSTSPRWALVSLALSMLLASLGVSIANIALPTLAQAFGATFQQVQWVIIAYLLVTTIMIVGMGRLGDRFGHRRVLLAGIGLFTLASILCALAPRLEVLIAARGLQGLGAAILMALCVALVRDTVPKQRTGSAMGLLGTMSAIGTALGPAVGGFLLAGPGWRAIFFVLVPLGMLNLLLAHRYLPAPSHRAQAEGTRFDYLGTVLLGLTLAAYALAVTVGGTDFGWTNLALLLAAALGLGLLVRVQSRLAFPLIPLATLRNRALGASLVMNALVATVMMATLMVGPFYLSGALGLNDALTGIVMSIGPVISALSGVPAGRIVDRWGAPLMVRVGLVAMVAGALALSVLPSLFALAGYIAAIAVLTPGYQLFQAANNTAVMMDVDTEQRGLVSGMLSLARNLGLITGAAVMGALFALASGARNITLAASGSIASGMSITFFVAALLILVAFVIALATRIRSTPGL